MTQELNKLRQNPSNNFETYLCGGLAKSTRATAEKITKHLRSWKVELNSHPKPYINPLCSKRYLEVKVPLALENHT